MTVLDDALDSIGDTPLIRLRHLVPDGAATVLVKIEGGNPTGSYKDRMARSIIEAAAARGDLHPGRRVVEFSGGSTGSSLAFVCAVKGYPLTIVSSDAFAQEKLNTIRALGGDVVIVPSKDGQIMPELFVRMRSVVDEIVAREGAYWVDQFHNTDALRGYERLGEELLHQTAHSSYRIDEFCAGVGTGGMLAGVSRALRASNSRTTVTALEPATAPMLTLGYSGPHRVEGIATGVVPPLMAPDLWDAAMVVDEQHARRLAVELARREGIFAGTSTALNVAGAIDIARRAGAGATVVTVACDTGLKYLAGDLFSA